MTPSTPMTPSTAHTRGRGLSARPAVPRWSGPLNPTLLRRVQKGLLLIGLIGTVMGVILVVACFRNDGQIEANKATVMADVLSADALHADVSFQTPDGQLHSPRLGLLYPTELTEGQRISVEYDATNPDLARPAGRDATLSIIPALSVVALLWLIVGVIVVGLAETNRGLIARAGAGADRDTSTDRDISTQ
ncbi:MULTISPECIES: DUF3592 domain-containing protein [Gordonia]|jgi:hypothetical protein|uniref:DUF3592 domain-containing protein n=1 Tax=Gordonia TaxID=2053 RepID=UPI002AFFDD21|nr:DUF3592 domain-containing protein [Gordonia pseudamarae]